MNCHGLSWIDFLNYVLPSSTAKHDCDAEEIRMRKSSWKDGEGARGKKNETARHEEKGNSQSSTRGTGDIIWLTGIRFDWLCWLLSLSDVLNSEMSFCFVYSNDQVFSFPLLRNYSLPSNTLLTTTYFTISTAIIVATPTTPPPIIFISTVTTTVTPTFTTTISPTTHPTSCSVYSKRRMWTRLGPTGNSWKWSKSFGRISSTTRFLTATRSSTIKSTSALGRDLLTRKVTRDTRVFFHPLPSLISR